VPSGMSPNRPRDLRVIPGPTLIAGGRRAWDDTGVTERSVHNRQRLSFRDLRRREDDRLLGGVSGGVADLLGIEVVYVRAAVIVLSLIWGLGVLLYLALYAATSDPEPDPVTPPPAADRRKRIGLGLLFAGVLLALRAVGLWTGDGVVFPAAAMVFGTAFLLDQRDIDSTNLLARILDPNDRSVRSRTVIGALLLILGLSLLGRSAAPAVGTTVVAVAVTGVGLTLVFSPWIWRLAKDLSSERRERIRQEERAEMAAHLHDSVLQTLALIQRTDDPKRMVTLARSQERELRTWLYERSPDVGENLTTLLRSTADRVEADFDIPVEFVNVGDVVADEGIRALAAAAGEAITNAAKHSGADRISVYAEVSDDGIDVFVADHGKGFDPDTVDGDRRGIAESIVGRMERHGGSVEVTSEPGEGTEVHLHLNKENS
jgi:signal transduction histidine kinase/phage shock protein PspC (stress-responsive transcriptional regulator)